MGKKENYVDVACKVADAMVQEREEWLGRVGQQLRSEGFGDTRRIAENLWDRKVRPRPVTGRSFDDLLEEYKKEGLL